MINIEIQRPTPTVALEFDDLKPGKAYQIIDSGDVSSKFEGAVGIATGSNHTGVLLGYFYVLDGDRFDSESGRKNILITGHDNCKFREIECDIKFIV